MAVDVLGHAVNLQICAMPDRIDADGAGEGSVYAHECSGLVGDFGNCVQIADAGGGVTRCFHVDQLGIGADSSPDGLSVGGVQQSDLYAVLFGQVLPEQQVGGAVTHLGDDGMVTGIQCCGEHGSQGCNAACKHSTVLGTGQSTKLFLQNHLVYVAVALVNVAMDAAPIHGGAIRGDTVVGGHVNGFIDGAKGVILSRSAMDSHCCDMQIVLHKWSAPSLFSKL